MQGAADFNDFLEAQKYEQKVDEPHGLVSGALFAE